MNRKLAALRFSGQQVRKAIAIDICPKQPAPRFLSLVERQNLKLPFPERTRQRFSYEAPNRLSWEMLEGELDSMEGYWELEDLGGGRTRVTYGLAVDPGSVGRLTRGPLERAARAILVTPRAKELARRVEEG